MTPPPGRSAYRLRLTLEDVVPTVWRRLLVPGNVRLAKLHHMFQASMGWTNSHLHSFTIGDDLYGMHFDDYPEEEIDEKNVTVAEAVGQHRRWWYEYATTTCLRGSADPSTRRRSTSWSRTQRCSKCAEPPAGRYASTR